MTARPEVVLVGTGPGPVSALTLEAEACLLAADRVLFRMSGHPVYSWLRDRGVDVLAFDLIYATPKIGYVEVYELIAASVRHEAIRTGRAVYALPGHPFVFEETTSLVVDRAEAEGFAVTVIPGVSFLDVVSAELRLNPAGLQVCNAIEFQRPDFAVGGGGLLIGGLFARATPSGAAMRQNVAFVDRWLQARFPPVHPISIAWTFGMPEYATRSKRVPLRTFVDECAVLADAVFATAYVPPLTPAPRSPAPRSR